MADAPLDASGLATRPQGLAWPDLPLCLCMEGVSAWLRTMPGLTDEGRRWADAFALTLDHTDPETIREYAALTRF